MKRVVDEGLGVYIMRTSSAAPGFPGWLEGEVEVKSGKKDVKKSLTVCKKFFIISPLCCRRSENDGAAELIFNNLNNR